MRKKDLINQNIMLFEQLRRVELENTSLKKRNNLLEKEISEFKYTIEQFSHQKTEEVMPEIEIIESVNETFIDDAMAYGSEIIGKIVLKATELNGELGLKSSPDSLTLINLILGKTEISKSEILTIISDDCSFETKKSKIDTVKNQAFEYFESVMAQID